MSEETICLQIPSSSWSPQGPRLIRPSSYRRPTIIRLSARTEDLREACICSSWQGKVWQFMTNGWKTRVLRHGWIAEFACCKSLLSQCSVTFSLLITFVEMYSSASYVNVSSGTDLPFNHSVKPDWNARIVNLVLRWSHDLDGRIHLTLLLLFSFSIFSASPCTVESWEHATVLLTYSDTPPRPDYSLSASMKQSTASLHRLFPRPVIRARPVSFLRANQQIRSSSETLELGRPLHPVNRASKAPQNILMATIAMLS